MSEPIPDRWGRYRVRSKSGRSGSWSTSIFRRDLHVIAPGPASDAYGAALPPRPYIPLPSATEQDTSHTPPRPTATADTEEKKS